jgi:hypothetical protein
MRIVSPGALGSALSLSSFLIVSVASAQDPAAKASAVQLFDEADKLMAAGNISAACPKYAASMKLDPQLGALLHLADCYAKNGQVASAWGAFREAEEMARNRGDDRANLAREQAAALEPRLSRLMVTVPQEANITGLEVRVDGAPITQGAWGVATPIDPGSHGVEARAPGYETWSSSIDVTGETQQVKVQIPILTQSAQPTPAPGGGPAAPIRVQVDDTGSTIRTLGWVSAGVGVVSLGLGGVFALQRSSKLDERQEVCPVLTEEECDPDEEREYDSLGSDANTAGTISTVGFVAGGVLLAGGIAAIIFAPKPKAQTESAWILPAASPNGFGLFGGMTW